MPKTYYTVANGMMLGERTDNGPRIDDVPDALGSVVAAVDENLNTTYTAAYKPYGDTLASTGTKPNFTWVGNVGYLASAGVPYGEFSVRRRIVSSKLGRWTSVDPMWPNESAYGYALSAPALRADPTGLAAYELAMNQPTNVVKQCACRQPSVLYSYTRQWTLKPLDSIAVGFIVQKVILTKTSPHCDGSPPDIFYDNYTYYEAWQVSGKTIWCGLAVNKTTPAVDLNSASGIAKNCQATYTQVSFEAYFFLMKVDMPPGFRMYSNNPCSLPALPPTNPQDPKGVAPTPTFWNSPSSNKWTHSFTMNVKCCSTCGAGNVNDCSYT